MEAFKVKRCFSQFDRKTDCFEYGAISLLPGNTSTTGNIRGLRFEAAIIGSSPITIPKAVCGTQTRMPEGFNLMLNQTQALSTPDNLVGGAYSRPYPTLSRLVPDHPKRGRVTMKLMGEQDV